MSEDLIERLKRPGTWARHADDIIASSATEELIRDDAPFEAAAEIERLRNLTDRLRMEAQGHSGEARAANSSLREAYQAVSGGKGEPGNWNGAEPIKAEIERLRARLAEAETVITPFAEASKGFDYGLARKKGVPNGFAILKTLTVGDLRAAAKWMEQSR